MKSARPSRVRRIVLAATLAGSLSALPATALDPSKAITQYVHRSWRVVDGLPSAAVEALAQSPEGYLWIGGRGVARFDGVEFRDSGAWDPVGESGDVVFCLQVDRSGALWIGTEGGRVHRLRDGRLETWDVGETGGTGQGEVTALYEGPDGTLWVGVSYGIEEGAIYRLEGTEFKRFDVRLPGPLYRVLRLHVDAEGSLWIGTRGALHRWDGTELRTWGADEGLAFQFRSILEERDGSLLIGTESALFRVEHGRVEKARLEHPALHVVNDVLRDRHGNLWIATRSGVLRTDLAGATTRYSRADGLSHDNVVDLLEDSEGNLWAATESGIDRFSDGPMAPLGVEEGLSHRLVWSILEDRAGRMWVGTGAGVDQVRDGRVVGAWGAREGLAGQVLAIHEDRAGNLWLGCRGGLNLFRDGRVVRTWLFGREFTADSDSLRAIHEDREGNLWIGGVEELPRLVDGRLIASRAEYAGAFAILGDREGSVWFGTLEGLIRLRDGVWTRFTREAGLADVRAFTLYESADGTLWIGTYGGGLSRLRNGRFTNYSTRVGLSNDVLHHLIEDDAGNLWMCSDRGISFIPIAELNAFAEGRAERVHATAYDTADGMRNAECNGGSAPGVWKTQDGRLWFPTLDGIVIVDPARRDTSPPPVFIEDVLVDGAPQTLGLDADVPSGRGELEVRYAAVALSQPHRVRYRYRLQPYDDRWIEAGVRRTAVYTSLPPGTYRFAVAAAVDDGDWSPTAAGFGFRLRPRFHQTRAFYGLCLAGLSFAGFVAYRIRVRQLERRARELTQQVGERTRDLAEQRDRTAEALQEAQAQSGRAEMALVAVRESERLKSQFFANVSHEFRTPLTLTIGPLENALAGAYGETGPLLERNLHLVLRHSRRLLRLINQLLDISKLEAGYMTLRAERGDVGRFLERLVQSFRSLAEGKRIALRYQTGVEDAELWFDPAKLEQVCLNLLSNAFKFTPEGGEIFVEVRPHSGDGGRPELAIVVRDSGHGIPADALPRIFDRFHQVDSSSTREHEGTGIGLSLARELVELHHGAIDVRSEPGRGTEFVVRLPGGSEHLQPHERVEAAAAGTVLRQAALELAALESERSDDSAEDTRTAGDAGALLGEPATLLIVDDNADLRCYVRESLGGPHRFLEASDGEDGLRQAREHLPDLIIADVMMPRLDGYELCRRIRADPALEHIPLILLTARASAEFKVEGLEAGADDYVAKPFNARELAARARNLIRLRRQERELKAFNSELERRVHEQLETILRGKRLTRYFSPSLVDWILEAEEELDVTGERRCVTMLFSDLAGFTGLSLGLSPDRLTEVLNEYLTAMVDVIAAHGGALDKFMGDGILALFGAPGPMAPRDQARSAVRAATAMHRRLAELEQTWRRQGLESPLAIRVGIHHEEVTVGNFGSERYLQFTAIGPGVNVTNRLQEICVAGNTLVSSAIHDLVGDEFGFRSLGRRPLRGISDVEVYELSAT